MPAETSSGRPEPAPSLRRPTTVERFEQLDVGHGEVERGPVARVCDRLGFLLERRCDAVVSGDVDHAFMLPRNPGGRWVMSRSSEQHDRSSQGRGPNSPIVALIQLGPLGCPAVHFGAQWLTVDIAVQVASLRGRRTLTFKNHTQVAHSCVAGTHS